jgi:uncharacterized protein (TIGR02246 family)
VNLSTPQSILDAYAAAVYDRDAEGFLRLYETKARIYDTWGVWAYEGTASRRQAIEGWFSSLGDERVKVTFDDVQITEDQALAVITTTGRYAAISVDGVEIRSMQNRFTWALQCKDGGWSIVHEHTSVPIGFNDLKGMLQRWDA